MSLRIPGTLPPPTPMVRRDEPSRRPTVDSGNAANPASPPGAPVGGAVPVRAADVEPAKDQWVRSAEAPAASATPLASPAAPEGAAAYGAVPVVTDAAPEEAKLAADRVRQDVLARPPQASAVHGNLVAATVLNLLA